MMLIQLIIALAALATQAPQDPIARARSAYAQAADDHRLCTEMIEALGGNTACPLQRAYLGGYQAMMARHKDSPFAKLKTFRQGRANIDRAVVEDPASAEIRFVRLSVQLEAPALLGYKSNIGEDRDFIRANLASVPDAALRETIRKLLK